MTRRPPSDSWIHHTVWQESDTTREEEFTMFRFMQRFGRDSQASGRGTGPLARVRRRNHQLNCEALEGRQLLSGFYIVNAASGKVLEDPGSRPATGTHRSMAARGRGQPAVVLQPGGRQRIWAPLYDHQCVERPGAHCRRWALRGRRQSACRPKPGDPTRCSKSSSSRTATMRSTPTMAWCSTTRVLEQ